MGALFAARPPLEWSVLFQIVWPSSREDKKAKSNYVQVLTGCCFHPHETFANYNGRPELQVKIKDKEEDARLFSKLSEQLERIEVSIDPYSESVLFEQWSYCIGEIMHQHELEMGPGGHHNHNHGLAAGECQICGAKCAVDYDE